MGCPFVLTPSGIPLEKKIMKVKLTTDSEIKFKVNSGIKEGLEKLASTRNLSVAELLRNLAAGAIVNSIASGELNYERPIEPENETLRKMNEAFRQAGKNRERISFE